MIINFKFSNFYSFVEEADVSFVVGKQPKSSYYDVHLANPEMRVNKVTAVVGANGAGKTHLIRALIFLDWFITRSMQDSSPQADIAYKAHLLHLEEPTHFEIEFVIHRKIYRYRLTLNSAEVLHESLHEKTSKLFSYLFVREKTASGYEFKQKKTFGFAKKQAENVRANVSILSAAYMYDVVGAKPFFRYFASNVGNVNVIGRQHFELSALFESAEYLSKNEMISEKLNKLLCNWDLGLENINYQEEKVLSENGEEEVLTVPYGLHSQGEKTFTLPLMLESNGTQSAFILLRRLLPVLETGGIAVIDELDNDLHPHMLPAILELFKFEETNPHHAQLIFSCHATELLNELQKHQVYLVEKNDLDSEAWRLDDIQGLRADDNLYAKYTSGALGGVPNFS